jgi:deoxyhypusine synthase
MIRAGKVHAICCTGANLEEDVFNLVAHTHYERVPHYRDLTPQDEQALLDRHLNRVTDTCIPEEEAMRRIERLVLQEWLAADARQDRAFPHEFLYRVLRSRVLAPLHEIDPRDSWFAATTPTCRSSCPAGRLDLGNVFAAHAMQGRFTSIHTVKSGIDTIALADWYRRRAPTRPSASSRSAAASPVTSRLRRPDAASGFACADVRCGATSVRSAIRRRAGSARARCPKKVT